MAEMCQLTSTQNSGRRSQRYLSATKAVGMDSSSGIRETHRDQIGSSRINLFRMRIDIHPNRQCLALAVTNLVWRHLGSRRLRSLKQSLASSMTPHVLWTLIGHRQAPSKRIGNPRSSIITSISRISSSKRCHSRSAPMAAGPVRPPLLSQ